MGRYTRVTRWRSWLVDGDVDLPKRFHSAPCADEPGFHHETVACFVGTGFTTVRGDFHDAFEDVAEFECLSLDGARQARCRFPDAGVNRVASPNVLGPGLERRIAGDQAFRPRL